MEIINEFEDIEAILNGFVENGDLDSIENADDLDYQTAYDIFEDDLSDLFDNSNENKKYIVVGSLGLWDGRREVYSDKAYGSLLEAIKSTIYGDCYLYVNNDDGLEVQIAHHDGTNVFEVRELTDKGYDLLMNYENPLDYNGTTKKVVFNP